MDLEQLYEKCCKLKVDEIKEFELDQIPGPLELAKVVAKLAMLGKKAVSLSRSGTTVRAYCFHIPDRPKPLLG